MLLLVVTTPIYLRILGPDRFGLYMLLAAVIAPFQVLNAGVSQATIKYLSAWLPQAKISESAAMMRIGLLFNCTAGLVAIFGLWIASPWLASSVFKISDSLKGDAIASFRIAAPLWLTVQIAGSLSSVIVAEQNFRLASIAQIARSSITYIGGIPVLKYFGSIAALQSWSIITYIPIIALWAYFCWRRLGFSSLLPGFEKASFDRSFGFSFWQILNAFASAISQQIDRVLLGAMLGTAAVGAYGIAASIQQRAVTLVWSSFATLFPAISRNSELSPEQGELDTLQKGNILSLLSCLAYTIGFWFSGPFCLVWLGADQNSEIVAYLLKILFLIAILAIPSAQIMQFLLGHGLTRLNFIGNTGMALIIATCSYICISQLGVKGAAVGALAGLLISRIPLHVWVTWKHMKSGNSAKSRLWTIYCIPTIFVTILALFSFFLVFTDPRPDPLKLNLFSTLLSFIFSTLTALITSYFFGGQSTFHHLGKLLYGLRSRA